MPRPERTVESMRLLQDWSKWLISLETVVCISLWPKLTSTPAPSGLMYAGWMMFWASIIIAAILLLCISLFVRRVDESGDRDIKIVWLIVGVQYACFLLGLACFALNLLIFWLGV
ncbi:MAG TPA: hypothetical protein VFX97_18835 [Pyrinomonadaceae bacterium]|nr:hypothetical protein [Pyrinomonadaceae bacterium]